MIHSSITWRGTTYRTLEFTVFPDTDKEEDVLISTIELQHELLDETLNCISREASELDDTITYYLTSDEIKLPEEEIRQIIENALSQ